jgi:hypothetical protein
MHRRYITTTMQVDLALTDKMVEHAISECAQTHFADDTRRARQALLRGDCQLCRCITESLIKQIAKYLGQVDGTVKAVYLLQPLVQNQTDSEANDSSNIHGGLRFIVWVERKSAALSALAVTLEAVLSASQRKLGCVNALPDCYSLDMEMVDDHDVQQRRGFGVLVDSTNINTKLVWQRPLPIQPPVSTDASVPGPTGYDLPELFDPEIMPESRLIDHALSIERLPSKERATLEHHLTELKVTLIRRMIRDQLPYINIAKHWLTISDLADIHQRRIGFGRIGGKAAGMLLAGRILNEIGDEVIKASVKVPESFFLGSDLMYIFMAMNGLMHWNDQKYKSEQQIHAEYPQIQNEFQGGEFPPEILVELRALLEKIGLNPLIVRSSSQLEDSFGTSFPGKYDSHFCPNQGTPGENLRALTNAIARTYASTFKPDALLYRRSHGLQDYDERMSALIQVVQGEQYGRYFFPFGAGVAFSHNLYRWAPQIRREDGYARLVWGLGTRAVERVGNDYPRLIALSHPTLQPDDSSEAIRHYSQQYVDLIDLKENAFKTLPVREVLDSHYAPIRLLVQREQEGYLAPLRTRAMEADLPKLIITFDTMLQRSSFASTLSKMLHLLEQHLQTPVDIEFTLHIPDPSPSSRLGGTVSAHKTITDEEGGITPGIKISLLQCRPQSRLESTYQVQLPEDLSTEDIVFSSRFLVPQGYLQDIRYVIFVPPEKYFALPSAAARNQLRCIISGLNSVLEKKSFICVGPGRWGTTNFDLGVYVGYADICNAGALVELSGRQVGPAPEPSLGTHFFQDLMEAQIYPIAIRLDEQDTIFKRGFFYETPSNLQNRLEVDKELIDSLRLIEVNDFRPHHHLELVMDDEKGEAVAYLSPDP